jgi:8-oxo-dGTP pyrophosphatase MutT (NUDIX family)
MSAHAPELSVADVEARVRAALAAGAPGLAAQLQMAPSPRPGGSPDLTPARAAAALLLVVPGLRGAAIVLTKRAGDLPQHAGQVSLPGGAIEPGEPVEAAALREAQEEVGADPARVRVLGTLTPLHIAVSGFRVHPVIGVCDTRPALTPAHREVERIVEVPLADLLDPTSVRRAARMRDGRPYDVPYFAVAGEEVWGATAMIVAEFLALLGWPGPAPRPDASGG